jgi:CO/xanthine dehydrogenase FAD-binding subunit
MSVAHFAYLAPRSVSEVVALLAERKADARILAGGTDLLPQLGRGGTPPGVLISLRQIADLRPITFDPQQGLTIGATARISELLNHEAVRRHYPAMADAAAQTATVQIRNMGTIAGNICNARPCADNVPTLIARGARITLLSARGRRTVELDGFLLAPGKTAIGPDELLTHIHVPAPPRGAGASYQSLSARSRVDLTSVSVAVYLEQADGAIRLARIVLGSVGPTPLRARAAEGLLAGQAPTDALLAAAAEARPITDIRASAAWRRQMVMVLTRRAITQAFARAGGES